MKIIEGWKGVPFLVVNPFVRKCVLALAMYLISSFKKRENRVSNRNLSHRRVTETARAQAAGPATFIRL